MFSPSKQQAAARLIAQRAQRFGYNPATSVFGHGEVIAFDLAELFSPDAALNHLF